MNNSLSNKITTTCPGEEESTDLSYHITRMRVPLFEVDLGQAVYHGNYFHLFELGREDFLRHIGFPYRQFMERQLHLTIVEAHCNYRKSIHYDEMIEIHTAITRVRRRSLSFSQHLFRQTEGELKESAERELCTQATLNMVCVKFSSQPTVLPEDFLKIIKK
jgi:acyl-CoA thioester hydrolase